MSYVRALYLFVRQRIGKPLDESPCEMYVEDDVLNKTAQTFGRSLLREKHENAEQTIVPYVGPDANGKMAQFEVIG